MSKEQFDLFEQPPPHLARAHSAEQITSLPWKPKNEGHPIYLAAQELVHFTSYLKLSDWQQKYLWPHLNLLLEHLKKAESDEVRWFELGYIISAMEIEQLRSRSAAAEICKKYGVIVPQ
jgi:uncharacterized protein YfaT (DUF1175 family)